MSTQIETGEREIVLLEDAHIRPMMGLNILEPLPSRTIPYVQVDPFILVHEGVVPITEERASLDTKHHHRGFDNLWYLVAGEASTGHSTGPGGAMERARLQTGSLLKLRTGSGVWHAEGIGEDELREGKAGRRGQLRYQHAAGEPLADCRSRSGWRAERGRCAARDALHAHGREAVRRDACLQRTVRGLTAVGPHHRTSVERPNASMRAPARSRP